MFGLIPQAEISQHSTPHYNTSVQRGPGGGGGGGVLGLEKGTNCGPTTAERWL